MRRTVNPTVVQISWSMKNSYGVKYAYNRSKQKQEELIKVSVQIIFKRVIYVKANNYENIESNELKCQYSFKRKWNLFK